MERKDMAYIDGYLEGLFELKDDYCGLYKEYGREVGKLVDEKQVAYGDSVRVSEEVLKVYLQKYKNEDNTYTIPESLLYHLFLQVRIIDKQNRIFNNPDGDLMSENPYSDISGYSLLGIHHEERKKKNAQRKK